MWLEDESGNVMSLKDVTITDDGYSITGKPEDLLRWSENYSIKFSDDMVSELGKTIKQSDITFKTGSAYKTKLNVTNLIRGAETAEAEVELVDNDTDMMLFMGAYDSSGVMEAIESTKVTAGTSAVKMQVAANKDSKIKIFATESLVDAKLVAEPYIEGENGGYYHNEANVFFGAVQNSDMKIIVNGSSNVLDGYLLGRVLDAGKTESENPDDYICIDAVRTDDDGTFSFGANVENLNGSYNYSISAYNADTIWGKTDYEVMTGNSILSLLLNGEECNISGSECTLTTKSKDISGMLVKYSLSEKAKLYAGEEELISGESRIDCSDDVVLTVVSENKEERNYTVKVEVKSSGNGGGGGGSSVSSGGGYTAYVPSDEVEEVILPDPIREATFTDVAVDHWAFDAIENLAADGIVSGIGEDRFEPDREVSRAEFAVLLEKMFGFEHTDKQVEFGDISDGDWYAESVYILAENGIISGIDENVFGAKENITREDMAVMIYRCVKDLEKADVREYSGFADEKEISAYALEAIEWLYKKGYINGVGESEFAPKQNTSRAQAAYILNCFLK